MREAVKLGLVIAGSVVATILLTKAAKGFGIAESPYQFPRMRPDVPRATPPENPSVPLF